MQNLEYVASDAMVASELKPILKSLFLSIRPEIPLLLASRPSSYDGRCLLYLHNRDIKVLRTLYRGSYLGGHLLKYLDEVFKNDEVVIYELPAYVPPLPDAKDVILIVPDCVSENTLFAYDILSFSGCYYTDVLYSDLNTLSAGGRIAILPFDYASLKLFDGFNTIILLNTNGYGPLSDEFFQICHITVKVVNKHVFLYDGASSSDLLDLDSCYLNFKITNELISTKPFIVCDDNQAVSYTHLTLPTTERV